MNKEILEILDKIHNTIHEMDLKRRAMDSCEWAIQANERANEHFIVQKQKHKEDFNEFFAQLKLYQDNLGEVQRKARLDKLADNNGEC